MLLRRASYGPSTGTSGGAILPHQLGIGKVPPAADPYEHRVGRRPAEVMHPPVVRLRDPPLDVASLCRDEALDSDPVHHEPLSLGVEIHGLVHDHRNVPQFRAKFAPPPRKRP